MNHPVPFSYYNHIVALSGGKDSTAMALRLKEKGDTKHFRFIFVCTPTGDELPEMELHWQYLEGVLGSTIIRLHDPDYPTIYSLIDHFEALPNFRQRWCTRILKIELIQRFYELVKPAAVYVGLRADETGRQGARLFDENIVQRFPMQEWGWTIHTVWKYLNEKGVTIPRRTDCGMCFYQRIGEWWNLWKDYPERWEKYEGIERKYNHTFLSPGKFGDHWPHALKDLRVEFEKGAVPRKAESNQLLFPELSGQCRVCSL